MLKEFSLAFKQSETGLWFVTVSEPPGVFIAHWSIDAILDDLPNVLRHFLKTHDASAVNPPVKD